MFQRNSDALVQGKRVIILGDDFFLPIVTFSQRRVMMTELQP